MDIVYGTGTIAVSTGRVETRHFLIMDNRSWFAFESARDRQHAMNVIISRGSVPPTGRLTGVVNHGRDGERGIATFYRDVVFEKGPSPTPVLSYEQKYKQLVKDLAAEAERRNWCGEWDEFAKRAGVPDDLIKREDTVEVTLRFKVPRSNEALHRRANAELMRMPNLGIIQTIQDVKKVG